MTRIITITGYKGGCGKSTTAINLAAWLARQGETVLVDADPNRTALSWAQRGSLPFAVVDQRQAIKVVAGKPWIVIDTPARPDSQDLQELAAGADLLILPTVPDIVSLDPMLATAAAIEGANYRILLTIVPPKPSREGELMQAELRANGFPVFRSMIRRSAGIQKAGLAGIPVSDLKGRDRLVWLDFEGLGKEVMEMLK